MKEYMKIISVFVAALLFAAPVFAQADRDDRIDSRIDRLDEALELTDEQEDRIHDIWSGHADALRQWTDQNPDGTREERREFARTRAQETHAAIETLLTPEQAEKFAEIRQKAGERRGDRGARGKRGEMRRGDSMRDGHGRHGGHGMRDGLGKHDDNGMQDGPRRGRGMRDAGAARGGHPERMVQRIADRLELTETQRNEVQQIVENHHAEHKAWRDANPDATRDEMRAFHTGHFVQLKSKLTPVLSPEQIEQLENMREDNHRRSRK